jgi:hypothetical protein
VKDAKCRQEKKSLPISVFQAFVIAFQASQIRFNLIPSLENEENLPEQLQD